MKRKMNKIKKRNFTGLMRSKDGRLLKEVEAAFGKMRNATKEEQESVNRYIRSISQDTGENFFDILDDNSR